MSFNFGASTIAVKNAGLHANAVIIVDTTTLDAWADEAEGIITAETRRDWVSAGSLNAQVTDALGSIVESLVAMRIISYDPTGYLTREADMLMNFNDDRVTKGLQVLKDFKSNTIQTI